MNSTETIVTLIETLAKNKYGSVNKMVKETGINRSIIDNMKREHPSIPNVFAFCKLANILDVSMDYLLYGKEPQSIIDAKEIIKDNLSPDERSLINTYRDLNPDGKTKMLDISKELWADYRQSKTKLSNSSSNKLSS